MSFTSQISSTASQIRLEKLLELRLKAGVSEKVAIDQRIWDLFGEEWAVMFTDLSGFSRKVEKFGIIHFLQTIMESARILIPCIGEHDGICLKTEGDSMLVIFRNVHKALSCSVEMQRAVKDYNHGRSEEEQVLLCIGLGFGHMLRIGDTDVFGEEVNSAAKLGEDTAQAWEILVTDQVRQKGLEVPGTSFEPLEAGKGREAYRLVYNLD